MEGLDFAVPVFLLAYASRFGSKIRPLQLQRLAVSAPGGATRCPPRGRFGFIPLRQQNKKAVLCTTSLFWRRRRDFLRTPSLAVRFLRTLASSVSQTCGRKNSPPDCFSSALQIPSNQNKKAVLYTTSLFWRRRRDLNPRASCPTYTLSRGASSPLEYFSIW